MTWAVDTPIRVGGFALAAIVEVRVSVHSPGQSVSANGEKRPLLFLLRRGEKVSGIDVKGHIFEAGEIDLLYPRAIERMIAMLKEYA